MLVLLGHYDFEMFELVCGIVNIHINFTSCVFKILQHMRLFFIPKVRSSGVESSPLASHLTPKDPC
jgi:hypothetical protein